MSNECEEGRFAADSPCGGYTSPPLTFASARKRKTFFQQSRACFSFVLLASWLPAPLAAQPIAPEDGGDEPLAKIRAWQLHELNDRGDLDYIRSVLRAPDYDAGRS